MHRSGLARNSQQTSLVAARVVAITCALVVHVGLLSCRRNAAPTPRVPDAGDTRERAANGERLRAPSAIPAPGVPGPGGSEIDVPLAWVFLPEEPAVTGSSPDALVAAELPCGYRAIYGNVSAPGPTLGVRIRARFVGQGTPDPTRPCAQPNLAMQYMSLQRLRTGNYRVDDATPRSPAWGASIPATTIHIVADDPLTPAPALRRVRACTPGADATCTGGGVCGSFVRRPNVGVCVPPLDPYLRLGRACPETTVEVALQHAAPFAVRAAPSPGAVRACLLRCDEQHPCGATLRCESFGAVRACTPP